ncbi:AbrB/MazE/SpoVT family DNA-binding domain-containing protein [Thermococcus barophilus]|nr:AbrB/MazE/SpoVT family DNA-binding domain-containing protein [Thermococcus barophilus]
MRNMVLSKFPVRVVKGLRFRLPKPLREKYNIEQGDFVVLTIEKEDSKITRTFKVSSDGLIYIPQEIAQEIGMKDGDLIDVSLLECIHISPDPIVVVE